MDIKQLKRAFVSMFDRSADFAVRAPGRVNLIGEHTDYNDGFVLPIAIEKQTVALISPRKDDVIAFASTSQGDKGSIKIGQPIAPDVPKWANYCKGVAAGLVERGVKLAAADILFDSDVPLGGGLSSSASLEVATALALLAAAGKTGTIADRDLALICQKAEHNFAGAPCGIMDQSIAIMGRAGRALLLDCRDGGTKLIPFDDPDVVLLVANTEVKHAISDGGYAKRRQQCEAAAAKLGIKALRDATPQMIAQAAATGTLDGKELMRARHVVGEIDRTLQAVEALQSDDYDTFGQLMYGSHASLRDDYEVSCEELDEVVEVARHCPGVFGARMTGGGFGGCAIILAGAGAAGEISRTVGAGFAQRFGRVCPIFATHAADGAGKMEL